MRLLFVSTDFPYLADAGGMTQGGGGACVAQLANALDKRGYEIEVVTREEAGIKGELYDFPIHRTRFYDLGFRESKITHAIPATRKAVSLAKNGEFDLIHTHNPTAGLTGLLVGRKYGISHIMTMHGPWATVRQKAYTRKIARIIEKRTVLGADMVSCDSEALLEEMIDHYSPYKNKLVAIPNAVETDVFTGELDKSQARAELGLEDKKEPIILYTGRFVEEKGLPYLLEAFKEVSDAKLLLLGGGFDEHLVSSWLSKNPQYKSRIDIIPYLAYSMMPYAYVAADIFALPSLAEGMSRSVMEAMSCARPVVATDVGGNPELIGDGRGILVKSEDAKSLADAINKLLGDENLRKKMGSAARDFAEKNLSVERRVSSFIGVYEKLIRR